MKNQRYNPIDSPKNCTCAIFLQASVSHQGSNPDYLTLPFQRRRVRNTPSPPPPPDGQVMVYILDYY